LIGEDAAGKIADEIRRKFKECGEMLESAMAKATNVLT
jgi:hypothetical protein